MYAENNYSFFPQLFFPRFLLFEKWKQFQEYFFFFFFVFNCFQKKNFFLSIVRENGYGWYIYRNQLKTSLRFSFFPKFYIFTDFWLHRWWPLVDFCRYGCGILWSFRMGIYEKFVGRFFGTYSIWCEKKFNRISTNIWYRCWSSSSFSCSKYNNYRSVSKIVNSTGCKDSKISCSIHKVRLFLAKLNIYSYQFLICSLFSFTFKLNKI